MKKWKQTIVDAIVEKSKAEKEISLRETCLELGYKHVRTEDCLVIMRGALKALPDYEAVKMVTWHQSRNPAAASLFTTLTFVEKCFGPEEPTWEEWGCADAL